MFTMSTKSSWTREGRLILLLLLLSVLARAQMVQSAHVEIPLSERENEYFSIISAEEAGVLLYRRARTEKFQPGLEVIRMNNQLREMWRGFIPLERNILVPRAIIHQNHLYLLIENAFAPGANLQALSIDLTRGDFFLHKINNLIQFRPAKFAVTGQAILIGGHFNHRPIVLFYDMQSQKSKLLPGFLNEAGDLLQLNGNEDSTIDVLIAGRNEEGRRCLWLRNYDSTGNLARTTIIKPGSAKHLIFGQVVKTPGDEQVVAGVYGRTLEFSRGLFVSRVNASGEYETSYYNFADLQNFFRYMKVRHEKRVKDRIQRRKIKGRKVRFNYRLLVHDLIPFENKYLLVGEAFYPVYQNQPFTLYYGSNYSPIIEGYRYTHAVVVCFSKNGKLLWDNSFEINDIKSPDLRQYIKVCPAEERTVLLYLFENAMHSKIIKGEDVVEGKNTEVLTKDVKAPETEWSRLEYWYEDHFYTYGVQHTWNQDAPGTKGKKVFFISKIAYR